MPATLSFGAWLRQRRKALGLTHAGLAEAVHCSVSALRKIESDERRPSHALALRLAARLQVPDGDRERFLELARGERRVDGLDAIAPLPPPVLPALPDAAPPLDRLMAPIDSAMPSVAVLPFDSLSAEPADEHFAFGLAEALLDVLARIPGLRVASRTSAFSLRGQTLDVPALAARLQVSALLEGSVRRAGTRVRIGVKLIDARSDSTLWAETYDRELQDLFAVQDDIAQSVVQALRTALLGEAADAAAQARARAQVGDANRGRSLDARAHALYLQGRFLIDRHDADETATGIAYCRRALEIDPAFALAWAGLARAYSNQASWGWAPLDEACERSRDAAGRALALEPGLPEAHAELGWLQMTHDWDWHAAETSYRLAMARPSSQCSILVGASVLADNLGRNAEATALAHRAVAVDPLSYLAWGNLALRLFNADRADEAADAALKAQDLNRRGALLQWLLGTIRLAQGRLDEAAGHFGQETVPMLRQQGRVLLLHTQGRRADGDAALAELVAMGTADSAFQIAEACAWRGEADAAFGWLDQAIAQRDPGVSQAQSGPLLRALHADRRWRPFLRRLGFDAPEGAGRG
ncbi:MAG: helix-turn-helix domain-containing protein [Rubrivivax sp.]